MFDDIKEDISNRLSAELRVFSLLMMATLLAVISIGFLCAAGIIMLSRVYGPVTAALAGVGVFLFAALLTMFVAGRYRAKLQLEQARERQRRAQEASAHGKDLLADPEMIVSLIRSLRTTDVVPLLPLTIALGAGLAIRMRRKRKSNRAE